MKENEHNQEQMEIMQIRERELLTKLEELKHICFGMYAKIIPENFDARNENEIKGLVQCISERLAMESITPSEEDGKKNFYCAFYQTSIYYLLCRCNEEDQIFLSLRKLALTFSSVDLEPVESTTFSYLMDNVKIDVPDKKEQIYAAYCLESYQDFKAYYEHQMEPSKFYAAVRRGVNSFVDKQMFSGITSEKKYDEVMRIVKDACNEVYFTVYQRWAL